MAQRVVGLDIGTSAVRAVEISVGDGGLPILEAYGQVGIPPGTVVDGEIRDRQTVVAALGRLWREGGFQERRVRLGVAGLRAITREIDMPPVPPSELDAAVRFQADQVVPFALDRTALSSKVIAQYNDADGSPQLRVLVAAAHRDLVDGVVETVQAAGLTPVGIDLDTAALARALYDPSGPGGPEVIVCVGAGLTLVVVHERGVLQFVRTIDLGGEAVTRAVASALDLPMPDAESLKRRLGEPGADPRAVSAAGAAVDELVTEIHNSIRFFSSLPGRGAVSRVAVTGGGARTAEFVTKLQSGLDAPVVPAMPLSRVDISRLPISADEAAAINPTLAVPVGLALPDPSGEAFNLLPAEVAAEAAERSLRRTLMLVGVGLVLVLAALTVWRVLQVNNKQNSVAALQKNISYIQYQEIPKYNKAVALRNQVVAQQAAIKPYVTGEVDWLLVLNQIGLWLPDTAVMTGMSLTSGAARTATTTAGTVVASASTTVSTDSLTGVTVWGLKFSQCPILVDVTPSGSYSPQGGQNGPVSFGATMEIGANALNQQPSVFTETIP
jgi:type IV pilus assembly protein PilM